jgi:hypothetical protein
MKKCVFILITMLVLNVFPNAFAATHHSKPTTCQNILGHWNGDGILSSWLLGKCKYHGSWNIKSVNSPGNFLLYIVVIKDSGGFLCPKQGKTKFTGVCSNGHIIIITKHGNLSGDFSKNGGFAEGRVSILPGIGGDLRVDFFKESSQV